jgi:hypothetical protein
MQQLGLTSESTQDEGVSSFASNAATLAAFGGPLGLASYVAFNDMSSSPAAPTIPKMRTRLGLVGQGVGDIIRERSVATDARRLQRAQDIGQQIMKGDALSKIVGKASETRAVIQAMLSTIDDPNNINIDQSTLLSHKEELLRLVNDDPDDVIQSKLMEELVGALYSADPVRGRGIEAFERNLMEFNRVGHLLEAPSFKKKSNTAFNQIDIGGLSDRARARLDMLGKKYQMDQIDLLQKDVDGEIQQYARIWSKTRKTWIDTLPLDLAAPKAPDWQGPVNQFAGTRIYSGRALQTGRYSNQMILSSTRLLGHLQGKSTKDIKAMNIASIQEKFGVSIEDYYIQEFVSRSNAQGFLPNAQEFRSWRTEILGDAPRIIDTNTAYANHVVSQSRMRHNAITLAGWDKMSRKDRDFLITNASFIGGVDPGVSADRLTSGQLGLTAGSPIQALRAGAGSLDRFTDVPSIARLEQITGGTAAFVGSPGTMGRGRNITAGANHGKNMGWSEKLTGAGNKAVLLDMTDTGVFSLGLDGQGYAYTVAGQMDRVRTEFTKPILDPTDHKNLSSKLLNRIMQQEAGTLSTFSRQEILANRGFLGVGPSGTQYLNIDPRMTSMQLGWQQVTDADGRTTINLVGTMDRDMDTLKLFGTLFKGTTGQVEEDVLMRDLKKYGITRRELRRYGLQGLQNTLVTSGEMMKKAPAFMQRQLISGFGMVSGVSNYEDMIERLVTKGSGESMGLGSGKLANVAGATIQALYESGVDDTSAGRVLSAVWKRGTTREGGFYETGVAIEHEKLKQAIMGRFGKDRGERIIGIAEEGIAIGGDSFSAGTGAGDFKLGRSSVEPRFMQMMQHRLKQMGMKNNDANVVLGSIYKNRMGMAADMKAAEGALGLLESLTGSRTVLSAGTEPRRVRAGELSEILSKGTFSDFLKTEQGGVILDLASGGEGQSLASTIIEHEAGKAFGGSTEIFLPGGESMRSVGGTVIRSREGSQMVAGEYDRLVDDFTQNINSIQQNKFRAKEEAAESMQKFKKNAVLLGTDIIQGLAAGKVKGSAAYLSGLYDMTAGTGLSKQQKALIEKISGKTKGTAVFLSDEGFLSQMKDLRGSASGREEDVAFKLRKFFLSSEAGAFGGPTGVAAIGTRHPIVGLGNVTEMQLFRDVRQLGQSGSDTAFTWFTASEQGKKALQRLRGRTGQKVRSFGDIAKLGKSHQGAVKSFFSSMTGALDDYQGEGGGRIFLASNQLDVHYGSNNSVARVDFGIAGSALGDHDGDQWSIFMTDKQGGQKIISALTSEDGEKFRQSMDDFKVQHGIITQEAKMGLKSHKARMQGAVQSGATMQDVLDERVRSRILSEKASKEMIGQLDVALNPIKQALLNYEGDQKSVTHALALLGVVPEHAVLKGKKLPQFRPFAEEMTGAARIAAETGDVGALTSFLRREIFRDTEYAAGGVDYRVEGRSVQGRISLEGAMDTIQKAMNSARSMGLTSGTGSAKSLGYALMQAGANEEKAMRDLLLAGNTVQSGMIGDQSGAGRRAIAQAGSVFDQIASAAARMDSKATGLLAIGALGSMMAMGAVSEGYAPKPLVMPGEVTSPEVNKAMMNQQLFSSAGSGPGPEQFAPQQDPYAMMERPINMQTTYMNRNSAYQVEGHLSSGYGLGKLANYMSNVSTSSGQLTINDRRRPLGPGYLDRILGDY